MTGPYRPGVLGAAPISPIVLRSDPPGSSSWQFLGPPGRFGPERLGAAAGTGPAPVCSGPEASGKLERPASIPGLSRVIFVPAVETLAGRW
ncbi:hypothetical protein [Streptomyces halobius]|uniref:Uncharacterized protein n=1 Tax=Streptomyces halobius TaxID=2879846 RepID=A0ABY4MKJ9_9ACTN|nr:hypothetical protein [Streptomyces halobius]UQA96856.1 hypothetical protein K9S39_37730 [Streptomyces halobius]